MRFITELRLLIVQHILSLSLSICPKDLPESVIVARGVRNIIQQMMAVTDSPRK